MGEFFHRKIERNAIGFVLAIIAVAHLADANPHDYVAIYDVDSRPEPSLIWRTLAHIDASQSTDGEPPAVVQQSARFSTTGSATRRWSDLPLRPNRRSAAGAGQTRGSPRANGSP